MSRVQCNSRYQRSTRVFSTKIEWLETQYSHIHRPVLLRTVLCYLVYFLQFKIYLSEKKIIGFYKEGYRTGYITYYQYFKFSFSVS